MGTLGTTVVVSAPNNQPFEEHLSMIQSNSVLTITQVIKKSLLQIEIETVAEKYRINKYKFYELAKCESSLRQYDENGELLCGTGRDSDSCGLYAFQGPTWDENCEGLRTNRSNQIVCAAKLISIGQIYRWPTCRIKVGL